MVYKMRDRREAEYELFRLELCFTRMGAKEWAGKTIKRGPGSRHMEGKDFHLA